MEIVRQSIEPIKDTLGLITPLNEKEIKEQFRTHPDSPYHYMTDLDFATVANFEERNAGVTGIGIAQNPARQYTYGAFASHILGYVGKADNQSEHLASDGMPYETIGRHGIEAIKGKAKWWFENHTIHSGKAEGPWPHGDRFIVRIGNRSHFVDWEINLQGTHFGRNDRRRPLNRIGRAG